MALSVRASPPGSSERIPSVMMTMRLCLARLSGRIDFTSLMSVMVCSAAFAVTAKLPDDLSVARTLSIGGRRSSNDFLCKPSAAFKPKTRVTASSRRCSLKRRSRNPFINNARSRWSGKPKRNISQPFSITSGTIVSRSAQLVKPAIGVASETTTPLKPSASRSKSLLSSLETEPGRKASTLTSGKCFRTHDGKAMCADITDITPVLIIER